MSLTEKEIKNFTNLMVEDIFKAYEFQEEMPIHNREHSLMDKKGDVYNIELRITRYKTSNKGE